MCNNEKQYWRNIILLLLKVMILMKANINVY